MARYRASAQLFIRSLVEPGEEFESDLPPGRHWEPLDDDARAAVERHRAGQGAVVELRPEPVKAEDGPVEIPDDWKSLAWPKRRALAQKLGARANVSSQAANDFIAAKARHRARTINAA